MEPTVLSRLDFDVLWENERFPRRHVALDVPSPGMTHTERSRIVQETWRSLEHRGLAERGRATPNISDDLALLAYPRRAVYGFIWAPDRKITLLAASNGGSALMGVVDGDEVWLIRSDDGAIADAAVSVAGDMPPGPGQSISLPTQLLTGADARAKGDPQRLVMALADENVPLGQAQALVGMVAGMTTRGQFGAETARGAERPRRAERVIAFHDTPNGRYLHVVKPSADRTQWSTITPADNRVLVASVRELLDEA
ncbi:ESX secretion-associated protein EspG [Kutzneria sp. NPDC051319]|uniref:ESX secretion-associated protein EspG n=1 Tax=Kutzneria sp. NPDC051319 TaxID=3155047 RepID=UPI00342BBE73